MGAIGKKRAEQRGPQEGSIVVVDIPAGNTVVIDLAEIGCENGLNFVEIVSSTSDVVRVYSNNPAGTITL